MADGKLVFLTKIDNTQVSRDLKQIEKKIRQSEEAISKNENAKLPLLNQAKELENKIKDISIEVSALEGELNKFNNFGSSGEFIPEETAQKIDRMKNAITYTIGEHRKDMSSLQKELDNINAKVAVYDTKIQQANIDIDRNKEKAGELSAQLNSNSAKMQGAFDKAHASAEKFRKKLLAVGASMIMFRLFSAIINGISKYMQRVLKTNEEYTAQLAQLKAALMTAFQPIYEFVLPGLMAVLKVLTSIVMVVANVLSAFSGKSVSQSAKNAEALKKEADALENVGGAAKDAGKSLANFDEINTLSTGESGGGGSGGTGGQYDFGEFDTAEYKAKIDELTVYLSGALLAIGAILAFSGVNIPLGIALMAAGALGMAAVVKENWGKMSDELKGAIAQVMFILGGVLLVIGAVLAFSGAHVALGIALMVAGASTIVGAAVLNWEAIANMLRGPVGVVFGIVSAALLVIGSIIAFSGGNLPLGIALMAAGALGLATVVAVNWNTIKNALQGPIGVVVGLVSAALLAVGAILAFSGVNLGLGIALMAFGAVGLVSVIALNWNGIEETLQGPLAAVVALAGASLLAIGAILAFSGANVPLGIAMMIAGGAALVSVAAVNWNFIRDTLGEAWEGIKTWFDQNVAPKLTLSYWQDKFSSISEGLRTKIRDGINAAIALFNQFVAWVNDKLYISWEAKRIGTMKIDAGGFQLLTIPSIPYLAQGAVLPPNKPFMAMVGDQKNGTNVEAPLDTIKQALAEVMAMYGGNGETVIRFEGDLAQLGRVLKPVIDRENNRVGGSLAKGGL